MVRHQKKESPAVFCRQLGVASPGVWLIYEEMGIIYDACLGLPFEGWFLFC
jgi:hypothetical protein